MTAAVSARRRWLAVAAWALFQVMLTSLPESSLPEVNLGIRVDWVVHFGFGLGAGGLVARALGPGLRRLVAGWLVIAVFMALDEWHQPWFGRSMELMDWFMDVSGAAGGLAAGTWLMRSRWSAWLT